MEWIVEPRVIPTPPGGGCTAHGCGKKDCVAYNYCPSQTCVINIA